MDHFLYKNGVLHAEDVAIPDIVALVGAPFYVYSTATLTRHFQLFDDALAGMDHLVCYAMKAASNQAILQTLAKLGAGMDVVSGGEYARARAAGVPGERIVFSGVGKTRDEMRLALTGGIRQFNVESEPEMVVLSAVAMSSGMSAAAENGLPGGETENHAASAASNGDTAVADAQRALARIGRADCRRVRHPSYGGKRDFLRGIGAVYRR